MQILQSEPSYKYEKVKLGDGGDGASQQESLKKLQASASDDVADMIAQSAPPPRSVSGRGARPPQLARLGGGRGGFGGDDGDGGGAAIIHQQDDEEQASALALHRLEGIGGPGGGGGSGGGRGLRGRRGQAAPVIPRSEVGEYESMLRQMHSPPMKR